MERSQGERVRLEHAIQRLRATLDALETGLTLPGPLDHATAQAVTTGAIEIAMLIARHDAFELAERDKEGKP